MNKQKKKNTNKTDFFDVISFWIPELLFLPFRILFMAVRGIVRLIDGFFDVV